MIPDIKEVYFPKDENGKQYATLSEAQVSLSDMGDKVITTTVKIDGSIVPDFSVDWEIEFQGERYIHPLRKPQASKDNTDIRSSIDLTFRHWAIVELQRYFFFELTSQTAGVAIPDKWIASLSLNLGDFITALNNVLSYWYGDSIRAELHEDWKFDLEPKTVSITYTHIWDVLTQLYEIYGCRWHIATETGADGNKSAVIQFGFPTTPIDHIFEYGFKGGLLKVERQVQSDDIRNILLGRGGEKNVPYRYFKNIDPENPSFPADPDWVYELKNVYFDRIRDAAFRSYVQGWKYAHQHDYENEEYKGQFVIRENAAVDWAWDKGYTDEKFDPVEFVKDDDSIAKYGERWGALEDNDEIYPTIQGMSFPNTGRVDQVVAVGDVVSKDDGENSSSAGAEISNIKNVSGTINNVAEKVRTTVKFPIVFYGESKYLNNSSTITIPVEKTANFELGNYQVSAYESRSSRSTYNYGSQIEIGDAKVTFVSGSKTSSASGILPGTWTAEVEVDVYNTTDKTLNITISYPNARITIGDSIFTEKKYANTFDIWVKNIWQTVKGTNESAKDYAERVWKPILGDREGNEARVVFTTGFLSISEDYEFTIIRPPVYDTSKKISEKDALGQPTGVEYTSEWRITLACSDADFDTLGVLVPNNLTHANAGDYFVFIGIDLPYLYYTESEKRLTAYKQDELDKVKEINPTWVVSLDKVRIGRSQYNDIVPLITHIKAGTPLRLTDPRFLQSVETLYIQSVTLNYKEPTNDDPYIVPDVEIVLSDKYETTANPVAMLSGEVSALQKQVGSISNIEQIVRIVADRLYLRKDGISDLSYSPTKFNSLVTSNDFRMGNIGGAGWGLYRDINGNAVLEIDRAIVRQDFEVNNLVINQISARGGMIVESAASMEISMVVDNPDGYYCYFDQKQGSIGNLFVLDDIAYCTRWDATNNQIKYYKRKVVDVGPDYVILIKGDKGDEGVAGGDLPTEGDVIVQYGNYSKVERQFVIVRDVIGGGYERFIEGLDSATALGTEYYFVGRQQGSDPRFFIGNIDKEYMEWTPSNGLVVKGKISSKSTYDDTNTEIGEATISSTYYYCLSNSDTTAPPKPVVVNNRVISWLNWQKDVPQSSESQPYVWQTTQIVRANGNMEFSDPICITGRDGESPIIYSLQSSTDFIIKSVDGSLSPTSVTFTKYANDAENGLHTTHLSTVWVKRIGVDSDFVRTINVGITSGTVQITSDVTSIVAEYRDGGNVLYAMRIPVLSDLSGLVIGGTNLLFNTNQGAKGWTAYYSKDSWGGNYIDAPFTIISDDTTNGVVWQNQSLLMLVGATPVQFCQFNIPKGVLQKGKDYALSFNIKATPIIPTMELRICRQGGTTSNIIAISMGFVGDGLQKFIFNIPEITGYDPDVDDIAVQINVTLQSIIMGWQKIAIWDMMLEEGNVATAWQPSPHDIDYLKKALQEEGSIEGGLILGSHIRLGYTADTGYKVMSGLNGIYNNLDKGGGIAFWAGGEMKDAEDGYATDPNRATSVIRMDGTGYMSNNNIRFKEDSVELGDNIVLSKDALSLMSGTDECVRITKERMPDDLAESTSNPTEINKSANTTSITLYQNGGITTQMGTTETNIPLRPITIYAIDGKGTAYMTVKVVVSTTATGGFGSYSPQAYLANVKLSNSDVVYKGQFVKTSNSEYTATINIPNVNIHESDITIETSLDTPFLHPTTQTGLSATARPSVIGTIQGLGDNMTLIGSNGIFSSWGRTALGVNEEMAIIRAGNFGVMVQDGGGIKMMLDGKSWYKLSRRSDDGTVVLN